MFFEDFELNRIYDIESVKIEKDKAVRFALEYDSLPVHIDEEYAKSTRFKRLIAPGVMSFMAVWNNFTKQNIIGNELIAGKSTKIEWFHPVFIGDTLKGKAVIIDKKERNPYNGIITIRIDIYNEQGAKVIENITETVIMRKPLN